MEPWVGWTKVNDEEEAESYQDIQPSVGKDFVRRINVGWKGLTNPSYLGSSRPHLQTPSPSTFNLRLVMVQLMVNLWLMKVFGDVRKKPTASSSIIFHLLPCTSNSFYDLRSVWIRNSLIGLRPKCMRKKMYEDDGDDGVWRRHGCWYFFEGHRENLYYDQQEVLPEQPCDAFIHLGLRPIIFLGFFFFFHLRWSILCDL